MRVAKFVSGYDMRGVLRQAPRDDGVMGGTQYVADPGCERYDFLVVFESVPSGFNDRIDPNRAIFVAGEPSDVKRYDRRFLAQFGTVVTTDRDTQHPNCIFAHGGTAWHIGIRFERDRPSDQYLDFRALEELQDAKTELMSVICSNKTDTPAQRLRIPLVHALKAHFGECLDFFGRGFREIEDKMEGLRKYRFHVVLENSDEPDYWSEKIADAFIAGAFPFYWGCRNLEEYFPPKSFQRIDLTNHRSAIQTIEKAIAADRDKEQQSALVAAKRLVLHDHNQLALLDRIMSNLLIRPMRRTSRLYPEEAFRSRLLTRIARRVRGVGR